MLKSIGAKHERYFAAILLLGVLLRMVNIAVPFAGNHVYKEIQYAGAAELFLKEGRFLEPRNYFTGPERITFPILPYLIVPFYRLLGVSELSARLPSFFFAVGTLIAFYKLALLLASRRSALISTFFMAVVPISVYFSRNIQPESPQLFFSLLSVYYYLLWQRKSLPRHLALATLAFSLSMLSKYTAAYMLAFFAANLYHEKKPLKNLAILSLALIPPALWYVYSLRFPAGGMFPAGWVGVYFASLSTLASPAFYLRLVFLLGLLFTPLLPLFVTGYFLKSKRDFLLSSWFIIALLHVFALVNGFYPWNEYYLYTLVAPMSLIAAEFLSGLKLKRQHLAAALLLVLLASLPVTALYYYQRYPYKEAGEWLRDNTPDDAVILIAENPAISFYAKKTSRIVNNFDDLKRYGQGRDPTYLVLGEFFERIAEKPLLEAVHLDYREIYSFRGGNVLTIRDGRLVVATEEIKIFKRKDGLS